MVHCLEMLISSPVNSLRYLLRGSSNNCDRQTDLRRITASMLTNDILQKLGCYIGWPKDYVATIFHAVCLLQGCLVI